MTANGNSGGRNTTLTALAGKLRASGADEAGILTALLDAPERGDLPYTECRTIAKSIGAKPAGAMIEKPAGGWQDALHELAARRGWTVEALRKLGAVAEGAEVHFPMRDGAGKVTGWRRRRGDNQPFASGPKALTVKGSKNGIFCAWPLPTEGPVLLVEGEADGTAAATAAHATVATPGAQPGRAVIETLQTVLAGRDVVLAPDPDPAGETWREKIGAALRGAGCGVRMIPPLPREDLDKRLRREPAAARTAKLTALIEGAIPWRPMSGAAKGEADSGRTNGAGAGGNTIVITLDVLRQAEAFVKHVRPNLRRWNEEFYDFSGAYHPVADDELDRDIYAFLDAARIETKGGLAPVKKNRRAINEIRSALVAVPGVLIKHGTQPPAWLDGRTDPDPAGLIVCRNGLLEISTRRLIPNNSRFFAQNLIDVAYDVEADCPRWIEFLDQLWANDSESIAVLQNWFGYVISGSTCLHKILMLYGPARAGKGTIARVLATLAGADNCCAPTLGGLIGNFGLQPLIGKSLAVIGDARISGRSDSAIIVERLLSVSGEDSTTIDRKNAKAVTLKLPTRFMLMANEIPRLADAAGVFSTRLILLRLTRSFLGREDDRLFDRLAAEMPGILRWALGGCGGVLEQPETGRASVDAVARLGSPVKAFVADCCLVGSGRRIAKDQLYAEFVAYAEAEGLKSVPAKEWFSRDLLSVDAGISIRRGQCDDGRRVQLYEGIELADYRPRQGIPPPCQGISCTPDLTFQEEEIEEKGRVSTGNTLTCPDKGPRGRGFY
jgi:putative DNA primase/helicase